MTCYGYRLSPDWCSDGDEDNPLTPHLQVLTNAYWREAMWERNDYDVESLEAYASWEKQSNAQHFYIVAKLRFLKIGNPASTQYPPLQYLRIDRFQGSDKHFGTTVFDAALKGSRCYISKWVPDSIQRLQILPGFSLATLLDACDSLTAEAKFNLKTHNCLWYTASIWWYTLNHAALFLETPAIVLEKQHEGFLKEQMQAFWNHDIFFWLLQPFLGAPFFWKQFIDKKPLPFSEVERNRCKQIERLKAMEQEEIRAHRAKMAYLSRAQSQLT